MEKYVCTVCGYVYDPKENGDVPFKKLDDSWTCPLCAMGKELFEVEEE